jgi:LuxR family maltose regulon positive regulatory protein
MATQELWEAETGGGVSHIIKRPRLTKILDDSEARIILLCAPAGYGKTTLAREWVATRDEPVLWYSGGPAMADVAALAVDLAELFAGPDSELAEKVRFLAARGERPSRLARILINATAGAHLPVVILDDYHYVEEASDADRFLHDLVLQSSQRFVITARRKPAWLDARASVYGAVATLSTHELAFTTDETLMVVPDGDAVQRVTEGWPVLIGLAAVRGSEAVSISAPPAELFDFFANDLYSTASESLKWSLLALSAAGDLSRDLAHQLLGSDAEEVIAAAVTHGFLTPIGNDRVVMHPLLRQFLKQILTQRASVDAEDLVRTVHELLIRSARWDQCLDLLESVPSTEMAVRVLEACLHDLLDSGRTETVRRWVDFGRAHTMRQPIFVLAEAEVSLRAGDPEAARSLAKHAAPRLTGKLQARADLAVARAAHLGGYGDEVILHTTRVASSTDDALLRQEALWLAFLASYEAQDPEAAAEYLQRLSSLDVDDLDLALRIACAHGVLAYELGRLAEAVVTARQARALFESARNPLIRTNYLNYFAHSLVAASEYREAIQISNLHLDEAASNGIEFAAGYALVTRAYAEVGVRQLREARQTLAQLRRLRAKLDDHVFGNLCLADAKVAIAGGDLIRAAAALDTHLGNVSRGFAGEFLAYQGLVHAATGEFETARASLDRSAAASRYVDAVAARNIGEAIVLAQSKTPDHEAVRSQVANVLAIGHRDMLLTGCRAYPPLAAICAGEPNLRAQLAELLVRSRDTDIARSAGITLPRPQRKGDLLSAREWEILDLLSQGRSNRQIAETLFISESTAKVHVRHIFEKLGVHTRVEAVAWLSRIELDSR